MKTPFRYPVVIDVPVAWGEMDAIKVVRHRQRCIIAGLALQALLLLVLPSIVYPIELTENDRGRIVSIPLGETISITLAGNPTTGYTWELADVNRGVLDPDPKPTFVPDSSLTGVGGRYTFRLFALAAGTTVVKLIYHRPWEKEIPPLRNFDLTVAVIPETRIITANYRSADGKTVTASFDLGWNLVTVTLPDGRRVTLPAATSASGARYSDEKETFWEHQGVGRFFMGEQLLFEGGVMSDKQAAPQPRFRLFSQADILKVEKSAKKSIGGDLVAAPAGRYTLKFTPQNAVEVQRGGKALLTLRVPGFANRPLEARWINAKLLYLELWFNPHNGAYWIYDVEKEKVLTRELLNDGQPQ
jgi:inhibitor of cysteine peptidase